jgi:hypothetical protein
MVDRITLEERFAATLRFRRTEKPQQGLFIGVGAQFIY